MAPLSAQVILPPPILTPSSSFLEIGSDDFDSTTRYRPSLDSSTKAERRRGRFVISYGPYTRHTGKGNYNANPEYAGFEWETTSRWSVGASHFKNSFSQPCWFVQAGRRFNFGVHDDGFFVKFAAGAIHGYHPPHADAVSLNFCGTCPAIVPSLGYKWKGMTFQLVVYGKNAGQMPLLTRDLP